MASAQVPCATKGMGAGAMGAGGSACRGGGGCSCPGILDASHHVDVARLGGDRHYTLQEYWDLFENPEKHQTFHGFPGDMFMDPHPGVFFVHQDNLERLVRDSPAYGRPEARFTWKSAGGAVVPSGSAARGPHRFYYKVVTCSARTSGAPAASAGELATPARVQPVFSAHAVMPVQVGPDGQPVSDGGKGFKVTGNLVLIHIRSGGEGKGRHTREEDTNGRRTPARVRSRTPGRSAARGTPAQRLVGGTPISATAHAGTNLVAPVATPATPVALAAPVAPAPPSAFPPPSDTVLEDGSARMEPWVLSSQASGASVNSLGNASFLKIVTGLSMDFTGQHAFLTPPDPSLRLSPVQVPKVSPILRRTDTGATKRPLESPSSASSQSYRSPSITSSDSHAGSPTTDVPFRDFFGLEEDFDKPTSPTCFEPHEIAQPEPDLLMSASNQGATWAPAEDGSLVPELTPPDLSNASLNLMFNAAMVETMDSEQSRVPPPGATPCSRPDRHRFYFLNGEPRPLGPASPMLAGRCAPHPSRGPLSPLPGCQPLGRPPVSFDDDGADEDVTPAGRCTVVESLTGSNGSAGKRRRGS